MGKVFMMLFALFELCSYTDQLQFNKLKKSVYGLSYDFYWLHTLGYTVKIVYSLGYLHNSTVKEQYLLRFPIHPVIPVNLGSFFIDFATTFISVCILVQMHFKHYQTKNNLQGFSTFCGVVCGVSFTLLLYLIKLVCYRQKKLLLLDIFDYLWLMDHLLSPVKLIPQIFINFLSRSTRGQLSGFLMFQWLAFACLFVGHLFPYNWYEVPANCPAWLHLLVYGIFLLLLTAQIHIFYTHKPLV